MKPWMILASGALLAGCGENTPATPAPPPAGADRERAMEEISGVLDRLAAPLVEAEVVAWVEKLEAHARAHPGVPIEAQGDDRLFQGLVETKFRLAETVAELPQEAADKLISAREREFLGALLPRYRALVPREGSPDRR